MLFVEMKFLSEAETTVGRVKTFRISEGDEGGSTYCPIIEFTTKTGETITFDTRMCSSKRPYEPGQSITVFYDPQNPQKAQVDSFFGKYTFPAIAAVIGVVFVFFGLLDFVVNAFVRKLRERMNPMK